MNRGENETFLISVRKRRIPTRGKLYLWGKWEAALTSTCTLALETNILTFSLNLYRPKGSWPGKLIKSAKEFWKVHTFVQLTKISLNSRIIIIHFTWSLSYFQLRGRNSEKFTHLYNWPRFPWILVSLLSVLHDLCLIFVEWLSSCSWLILDLLSSCWVFSTCWDSISPAGLGWVSYISVVGEQGFQLTFLISFSDS